MTFEIDELDLGRYSPAALRAKRPDLLHLAQLVRQNLHAVESALGIGSGQATPPDLADELRAKLCVSAARIEGLEHDLATARARIEYLDGRIVALEDDEEDKLYRKVGLVPSADPVVIEAARRALLARLHPDRAPCGAKIEATRRFAVASAAFDEITRLRR